MKKIAKIISSIGHAISKSVDKIIVVPISKFFLLINKRFDKPSKIIENWLSRPTTLLIISLLIAITTFIFIDQKILTFSESSAEVLTNQPVTVLYDEDNYVVEGIPNTVDITLIGSKADLYIAKQSPTNEVTIDLWGLKPGTHKVDIKYSQATGAINYSVNPSVATVIIYEKVSSTKTVAVDMLNQDSLDSTYIIDSATTKTDSAVIKGASYKVAQVATIKALVDMNALPEYKLGEEFTISSTLKAYDQAGNVVDVEISPAKVDVQLLITSPSKAVPLQVVPTGNVIYTMGISSLTVNKNENTTITIYGSEEVLSTIEYIPVNINVDGLSESTEFNVDLEKPNGVKSMSMSSVTVNVSLSNDISNSTIEKVGINATNLGSGYGVTPVDIDSVDVKIKGVTGIISGITADDITAYLDLTGLGVGTHEVEIKVKGNDPRVEYQPAILKMKVKIYAK